MTARYDLVACDIHGKPFDTIDCAVPTVVSWVLNQPLTVQGTVDTLDAKVVKYFGQGPEIEYQLLRNGQLLAWGPLVRAQPQLANPEVTDFVISDQLWYFHRRNTGKAGRTNLLANPTFSGDVLGAVPAGWAQVGCTAAVTNDYGAPTYRSVRLSGASAGADAYLGQLVAHTAGASEPDLGILTATFILESFSAPAGPGQEQRGLFLGVLDHTGTQVGEPQYVPITNGTGVGALQTVQIAASMPAAEAGHFDVRLYNPEGTVVWRDLSLVLEESLSTPPAGEDQSTTLRRLVDYFQGRAPLGDGKSDLNITANNTLSNVNRIQSYQFASHDEGLQVFTQYPSMADGVDYSMKYPDRHTRNFWIEGQTVNDATITSGSDVIQSTAAAITNSDKYSPLYSPLFPLGTTVVAEIDATHFRVSNPATGSASGATIGIRCRKGSYKPDYPLVLNKNCTLVGSQILLDAEQGGTDFIELGTEETSVLDNGAARPEGGASDSSLLGGLTLMVVEQAPANLPMDSLNSLAKRRLSLTGGVPLVGALRCYGEQTWDNVSLGDVVPVRVDYGWVQVEADRRVVGIDLRPTLGDVFDFTLALPVL